MLNFKKGSIFSRSAGNEDAYEEYEQEDQGGVLAVWGSPGSGKTTVAARIAKHLAGKRKNTILLLCGMSAPMHLPTQGSRKQRISGERLGCRPCV